MKNKEYGHAGHFKLAIIGFYLVVSSAFLFLLPLPTIAAECANGETIPTVPSNIPEADRNEAAATFCSSRGGLSTTSPTSVSPNSSCPDNDCEFFAPVDIGNKEGTYQCGKGARTVTTGFNLGCRGEAYPAINANPIIDMAFGIFRYLSAGVGLVLIGSIILAGIQYSASRGNPQAVEASIKRITSTIIALLIYVFMFAIANFLVPGGILI